MTESQEPTLNSLLHLNVWHRRGERAPHKPLLVLLALRNFEQGLERLQLFEQLEEPLAQLLQRYSPDRKQVHPEYPFWRLEQEVWEVIPRTGLKLRKGNTDPPKSELLRVGAKGGFVEPIWKALLNDPILGKRAGAVILHTYFPGMLHSEIADAAGLSVPEEWLWPLSLPVHFVGST